MGYGTTLTTDIYFNRKSYNSKYAVECDLKEVNENIDKVKQSLLALVMTTEPNKVIQVEEDEYVIDVMVESTNELLVSFTELIIERDNLSTLLEVWDECHDKSGNPIRAPKGCCGPYIDGDFINDVE